MRSAGCEWATDLPSNGTSDGFRSRDASATAGGVLIAGAGEAGSLVCSQMVRYPESGYVVVGFVDDHLGKAKTRMWGVPVLGTLEDIPSLVESQARSRKSWSPCRRRLPLPIRRLVNICRGRGRQADDPAARAWRAPGTGVAVAAARGPHRGPSGPRPIRARSAGADGGHRGRDGPHHGRGRLDRIRAGVARWLFTVQGSWCCSTRPRPTCSTSSWS